MARRQASGRIRVGIGGWIYAPWRGVFYPKGLKQADELAYAASHLTSIEINATHYRLQSKTSFRKWAAAAPDGFVFSVKGPRLVTQHKVLAETGNFIKRFFASGLAELGDKLGPVLWQFAPFKKFDRDDFARFLDHLPPELDGLKLNHVVEPRHAELRRSRPSSSCCAMPARAPPIPTPRPGLPSPTSPAISSMRGCNRATMRWRPHIRRRSSTPGPSAPRSGRKEACLPTFRWSTPHKNRKRSPAIPSSTSSMKGNFGRRPRPWR